MPGNQPIPLPTYRGLPALELGGELGQVLPAESVRLLQHVHHLGQGKEAHELSFQTNYFQ